MELFLKKEMCCGCSACVDICPEGAISMIQDREGFYYPKIENSLCNNCRKCEQVCVIKRKIEMQKEQVPLYLGVQAKNQRNRFSSSSGGIFSILAQYVIGNKGIVYGAGYGSHMKVVHQEVVDMAQLVRIKGTKYVQSEMNGVYRSIEKNLKNNKWVLFCGTSCQAQALLFFLKRDYEKLIVVDLVCYGVPSPGIWIKYVKHLEYVHNGKMSDFSFRDKRNADDGHLRSYIIDGKEHVDSLYNDFFCKMYFRNKIIRPSCHNCKFCTVDRGSDFTIGDFWGIEDVRSDMNDGMGTSMVIVHTDKAKEIWKKIREETKWFECMKEEVLQPRLLSPTVAAKNRWRFMLLYKILPFSLFVKIMDR